MKKDKYDYALIGDRIKKSRIRLRYTQAQLGELIDVATKHVSQIERGTSGPSIPTLMRICQVLNINSDYLLFGEIFAENNPINDMLHKLNSDQTKFAEELLSVYIRSCGVE